MKRTSSMDGAAPEATPPPPGPAPALAKYASVEDAARAQAEWERWQFNLVAYAIMTILGVGVLLPWNVAINAFDFFDAYFPTQFNFWLAGAYVWPQVGVLLLMVKFGKNASFTTRIVSTFVLQGIVGTALPFIVGPHSWSEGLVLASILCFGVCAGVLQSSLVGFSSQFPKVFNQALMTGQGVAGLLAGVLRITTKALLPDALRESAILYFSVSAAFMVLCTVSYLLLLRMQFTQYHLSKGDTPAPEGGWETQSLMAQTSTGSVAAEPVAVPARTSSRTAETTPSTRQYELPHSHGSTSSGRGGGPSPAAVDEKAALNAPLLTSDVVVAVAPAGAPSALTSPALRKHAGADGAGRERAGSDATLHAFAATPMGLKFGASGGGEVREAEPAPITEDEDSNAYTLAVVARIWKACLAVWICYFVTFLVFPAEIARVQYAGDLHLPFLGRDGWWDIMLVMTFNIFDTAGRSLPAVTSLLTYDNMVYAAVLRVAFIVIIIGAVAGWSRALSSDITVLVVMTLFAISNGYITTSVMMLGPRQVAQKDREVAGFVLSFFLLFGMFSGTLAALAFGTSS